MKKGKLFVFPLFFIFFFILSFSVIADTTEIAYSTKDSYVSNKFPNDNYGNSVELFCSTWEEGINTYEEEVYMYFDLSTISSGWSTVDFYFHISNISQEMDFDYYSILGSWSENSITWNNKPAYGPFLFKIVDIDSVGRWFISDIGSYFSGNEFSICITAPYDINASARFSSKEILTDINKPYLEFSYAPPIDWITIIIVIVSVIGAAAVLIPTVIILRKKKRATSIIPKEKPPIKEELVEEKPSVPQYVFKLICPHCGKELIGLKKEAKFCGYCGKEM